MIYDSSTLRELERKELELKFELEKVQSKIRGCFTLLPKMYIHSTDSRSKYEKGFYTISLLKTTARALSDISGIKSDKESTIITLKSGEKVAFEEYFSKEAIDSIIKIKQIIVSENYLEDAIPFEDL